ncbi:MAG: hypothetical protein JXQ67_01760 [Campylobacterales bacterium]|nr:hypothetical protein [Campylobacterales bacterium]
MEFFLTHKKVILRVLGAFLLLVGFVTFFWATPKEGVSANELAAMNVARMEAKVAGSSSSTSTSQQNNSSKFLEKLQATKADQLKYLTIFMMLFGIGFLAYSFFKKEE